MLDADKWPFHASCLKCLAKQRSHSKIGQIASWPAIQFDIITSFSACALARSIIVNNMQQSRLLKALLVLWIGLCKQSSAQQLSSSYPNSIWTHDELTDAMLQPSSLSFLEAAFNLPSLSSNVSTAPHNNVSFNESFAYDDDAEEDEDDMGCYSGQNPIGNLITMILYTLVCIVGLFGNTLVIYVVLRFSKMQTVTNIYILNLAIADECFLIGIPFLLYTMQIGSWKFGEYMCKAYMVSTSITQFTSSIFLLIMSADRYIAVCHPISSPRYRTPLVSKIVSGIAWLASAVLMLPVILFASTVQNGEHISCNIKWPERHNTQSGTTFILYTLTLGFATPLCFILCFYYLVIRKLHNVGPKNKSKEKKRSHRKVTKLVLTVITVYIMCWLPYWISQVALINSSPSKCASTLEITIFLLVGCLGYSNSAMNPILYAFLSDNFKKSFMKACTCAARKDINAQLQLENSMFPKFGGGSGGLGLGGKQRKGSTRLLGGKSKPKKFLARNLNASNMLTTTTTTGTATATTYADLPTSVCPEVSEAVNTNNVDLLTSTLATNATVLVVSTTPVTMATTHATDVDNKKPPVLHTDL